MFIDFLSFPLELPPAPGISLLRVLGIASFQDPKSCLSGLGFLPDGPDSVVL